MAVYQRRRLTVVRGQYTQHHDALPKHAYDTREAIIAAVRSNIGVLPNRPTDRATDRATDETAAVSLAAPQYLPLSGEEAPNKIRSEAAATYYDPYVCSKHTVLS